MPIRQSLLKARNRVRRVGTRCGRSFHIGRPRIIASMTSYPGRIDTVHVAIESLLAQHMLPDMVILWLCKDEFPHGEQDLPQSLRSLLGFDVKVRWVSEDLKPHKKYFWAMQEFFDDIIITVDDDLIYPNTMIEDLMSAHEHFPEAIAASRTHLITFNEDGSRKRYEDWIYEAPHYYPELVGKSSMRFFATSGAGTLFPPHAMPPQTFDQQRIMDLCPTTDDIWLKVMQVTTGAGIPVVPATDNQLLNYVPGTQDEALCHENTENGGNDAVMNRIFGYFDQHGEHVDFDCLVQDSSLDRYVEA